MTSLLRFRKESRRRRGEHRDGADGASGAELRVDNCEYVRVEGASTLLRVQVGSPGGDFELGDLTLVSRGDAGEARHDLLAPPTLIDSAGDGTWQLVFALPAEIVEDGDTRFELSRGDRVVVRLGRVPDREALGDLQARLDRERSGRLRAEELLADSSQDLADARALVEQLERRAAVGERNLAELRQKLLLSWTESSELRQLLESREEAHENAKQEARTLRDKDRELRALLADQEREFSAAREKVQRRCDELEQELGQRQLGERAVRQELEEERTRTSLLQEMSDSALEAFQRAREETDRSRAELEKIQAERGSIQQALEGLKDSERKLQKELSDARVELELVQSGKRGQLRKALQEAQAERVRLESELTGLLFHLDDLDVTAEKTNGNGSTASATA